jgi:hypothetical protein
VRPSYNDSGLLAGQRYNYRVQAVNQVGSGAFSSVLIGIAGSIPVKIKTQKIVL